MTRQIKFRARHKESGEWHIFTLQQLVNGHIPEERYMLDNWCEYTGLLDKNGKEIYEGDIVKCTWHPQDHPHSIPGTLIGEFIGYIEYNPFLGIHIVPGMFQEPTLIEVNTIAPQRPPRKQEEGFQILDKHIVAGRRIEIIGNIYQNPELVK